ncbi:helix-turn-helix domain-containing protein [Nocardia ignorata]|uniref:helix-turn-helix domain-containing protein n=1 Tax=Nocardia ignorata TaxID=145285 RepID=UPI000A06F535|nr:helix-turn-helix transcriptional regulator [Nocardia ignorata]
MKYERPSRRLPDRPRRRRRRDPTRPDVSIPDLGTTCRWIREDLGLTREEAADAVGFSAVHLGRIERSEREPSLNTLEGIVRGYRLDQAMSAHLHDLAIADIPLAPTHHLRTYVQAEPALAANLERFQTRGVLAAYIDPMSNVLSRNDLFADLLIGIDDIGSVPVWMFGEHAKTVLVDPDGERSWMIAKVKAALGRHRTSVQAKELVAALSPNNDAQRLWAASVKVSLGRDARRLLHAHSTDQNRVSYQLSLTDSIVSKHIQLVTATPETYSGPVLD